MPEEMKMIRISNLEMPVEFRQQPASDPKLDAVLEKFRAGKNLVRDEIDLLINRVKAGTGNGNCIIC
jgi:hypothetical protein